MNYLSLNEIWESIQKNFPAIKELSEVASDGSKIISTINKARKMIIKNKIRIFFYNLSKTSDTEINEYLNSIKNDENKKTFFIETLTKVIDVNDDFQIYILTQLVKRYNIKNELNYWEKSLYYNIKSFSEDDFMNLYNFLETLEKPIQHRTSYGIPREINDELNLSIKKLETIGILSLDTGGFAAECINLSNKHNYSIAFSFYPFIDDLYEMIENFKNYENAKI